jgi:hypothetical protein
MKARPDTIEGPEARQSFKSALKTVLSVSKTVVPNPFKKSAHKARKPATTKG